MCCLYSQLTIQVSDAQAGHGPSFPAIYEYPGRWQWEGGGRTSVYVFILRLCSAWILICGKARATGCVDPLEPLLPLGTNQLRNFDL